MDELQLDIESTPAEVIFRCAGRITSYTTHVLQTSVRRVMPERKIIVLDLSKVTHVDSSGLGALVGLWASAHRNGGELKLISLTQRVKELLHLTSLDKVFATSRFPDTPSF